MTKIEHPLTLTLTCCLHPAVSILLSPTCCFHPAISVLLSRSCSLHPAVSVLLSPSYCLRPAVFVLLSLSCCLCPAVSVLLSLSCHHCPADTVLLSLTLTDASGTLLGLVNCKMKPSFAPQYLSLICRQTGNWSMEADLCSPKSLINLPSGPANQRAGPPTISEEGFWGAKVTSIAPISPSVGLT